MFPLRSSLIAILLGAYIVESLEKSRWKLKSVLNNYVKRQQAKFVDYSELLFRNCRYDLEMFYLNSTLNFGIPPVLVFQLEVFYKVDRFLTGLTAQQKGTTARWYSNKSL